MADVGRDSLGRWRLSEGFWLLPCRVEVCVQWFQGQGRYGFWHDKSEKLQLFTLGLPQAYLEVRPYKMS